MTPKSSGQHRILVGAELNQNVNLTSAEKAMCKSHRRLANRKRLPSVNEDGLLHGLIVQAGKNARAVGGWQTYWPRISAGGQTAI